MTTTRVELPDLFDAQRVISEDEHRFRVIAAGRRFGKTKLAAWECAKVALDGGRTWWVAPTFPLADIGWQELKNLCRQIPGAKPRLATRTFTFPGGGSVQARSALNEAGLRGAGLDFVVVDECAFMPVERWTAELRPALSDRLGRAMFISTPKGRNWFWRLWEMGQSGEHPDWMSWQLPSTARPTFSVQELEDARRELPDRIFRQEYLAEFMADTGSVFPNIEECSRSVQQYAAEEGETYVFGVDLGRIEDATVISVMEVGSRRQVYVEAFIGTGWDLQKTKIMGAYERFDPRAVVIETNFNDSLAEELVKYGLPVVPFRSSNATKAAIINDLVLGFETMEISILGNEDQAHELKAYTFSTTKAGLVRYHAPEGEHDDYVIALALAWQGLKGAAYSPASTWGLESVERMHAGFHAERPGPQVFERDGVGRYNSRRHAPGTRVQQRITGRRRFR